ncbi:hypothetical protein [Mesobacillus selenatarsenatis]|uniref:Uncharacterized protein n=1 Tax=Mesobacillus selenatarsenatis (strain DSM 18680 / JCM 14380 / FERM P-15431 / SF-1) TaxID=1321606 RepID=A0A0A8X2U1_MESS1|nr:hypothetical protein [Mesobacillus selenatarsenatis]GAM12411.1 hypothetical protein SAMD00020551_0544 [Mesobacillus selenatarsenatis SF-1]
MIGTEKILYKIEMVEDMVFYTEYSSLAFRNIAPFGRPKKGIIKKGITGDGIKKWGRKYFAPDVNQTGIEDFTPPGQPHILIPYKKVENRYKIIG